MTKVRLMDIDPTPYTYKDGKYLRVWSEGPDGFPVCAENALEVASLTAQQIADQIAANDAVRAKMVLVEQYEAKLRKAAEPEPPATVKDEQAQDVTNPEWTNWDQAAKDIQAAAQPIKDLAALRQQT